MIKSNIMKSFLKWSFPVSPFFNQMDAPEHASAETLGRALFESESFESWAQIYTVNSASIFFVTTAFLGLLAKGSEDRPGYTSCVINNSSISAHIKLAQNHVRRSRHGASSFPQLLIVLINPGPVRIQQLEGCRCSPHQDDGHRVHSQI